MTFLKQPCSSLSLFYMTDQYETLHILSEIAEASKKPTQYQCTPRELILQSKADWDKISKDLETLESEALVKITPSNTPLYTITSKGLNKVLALQGKPAHY
jgi:predicted transcriptional regulator